MRGQTYYMLSFDSTHAAMRAEQYLKEYVLVCAMPTLRAVSAGCGISLRIEEGEYQKLEQALKKEYPANAQPYRLYLVTPNGPELVSKSGT